MIRRWSCLNNLRKSNKIIFFKNTNFFKKFTYYLTKFKRKKVNKRKIIKNWLIYINIFKWWAFDYKFNKKLFKFFYANNFFLFNLFLIKKYALYDNFKFLNLLFLKNFNYNIIYFCNNFKYKLFWINNKNYINTINDNKNSIFFYKFEDSLISNLEFKNLNYDINNIFKFKFNLILKNLIQFYKILIILFLYVK